MNRIEEIPVEEDNLMDDLTEITPTIVSHENNEAIVTDLDILMDSFDSQEIESNIKQENGDLGEETTSHLQQLSGACQNLEMSEATQFDIDPDSFLKSSESAILPISDISEIPNVTSCSDVAANLLPLESQIEPITAMAPNGQKYVSTQPFLQDPIPIANTCIKQDINMENEVSEGSMLTENKSDSDQFTLGPDGDNKNVFQAGSILTKSFIEEVVGPSENFKNGTVHHIKTENNMDKISASCFLGQYAEKREYDQDGQIVINPSMDKTSERFEKLNNTTAFEQTKIENTLDQTDNVSNASLSVSDAENKNAGQIQDIYATHEIPESSQNVINDTLEQIKTETSIIKTKTIVESPVADVLQEIETERNSTNLDATVLDKSDNVDSNATNGNGRTEILVTKDLANTNILLDEEVEKIIEEGKKLVESSEVIFHELENMEVDQAKEESKGEPRLESSSGSPISEDKSKTNFLTSCHLKEADEESSRSSSVDTSNKDEAKSDTVSKSKEKIEDELEFIWEKHLEETESQAVPPTAFKHVESSLESGFVKYMKLEVPNKCNKDTYWVASVLMTCGPLLRLRFDGYEDDSSSDFWCDLMTSEIHPIGWCAQNNQILQPPEEIKDKFEDWRHFLVRSLTGARTAPAYLLDKNTGISPIDQLKQGMRLELQHPINPLEVWLVKILENVGGRLYLRFEGLDTAAHDFWLFYLNQRLHPIGWAKNHGFKYNPPKELNSEENKVDWEEVLKVSLKEAEKSHLPSAIFKEQEEVVDHSFEVGWKLEALNPINRTQICPATVIKVLNAQYFVVEIDDLLDTEDTYKIQFSCHAGSKCIFPAKWCHSKGVAITPPNGWPKSKLSWAEYLEHCNAEAAPEGCFLGNDLVHEFERGMKFEAVNPENPNQICVATIKRVVEPLLWIHLDNSYIAKSSHIEHMESHNLFPVGWCESNGYQLRLPVVVKKKVTVIPEVYDATSEAYQSSKGCEWCPKVYYNHQCFSGPHLSKGRIASLPKSVGPGPINLVLKEAISMLINVAYKPCRVLKELQLEGKPNPDMHQQILKAKYKGKGYRATVEICKHPDNLVDFCRKICNKLECCPNLLSPNMVDEECPENCSQLTKTQYTYYNPKKKVGRPPGGHTNLENGPKKPGKKSKKKKITMVPSANDNGSVEDADEDRESVASDTKRPDSTDISKGDRPLKRKYGHPVTLPTEIKTRGAKLPKYSYDRKTHKKIPVPEKQQHAKHKKAHQKEEKTPHISPVKTIMKLNSNPLYWSVQEVVRFIKGTECAPVARVFKEQEIDGQALLLLTLPTVQEYMELKLGPAIKLCHHIEKIKVAFFNQYAK